MPPQKPILGWGGPSLKDLKILKGDLVHLLELLNNPEKNQKELTIRTLQLKEYFDFCATKSEGEKANAYVMNQIIDSIQKKDYTSAKKQVTQLFEVLTTQESTLIGPRAIHGVWSFLTGRSRKKEEEPNTSERKAA